MSVLEAIILGILQGITEFLPISSSGHLELGKYLLGINIQDDLLFTLLLHLATVISILLVYKKDIAQLLKSLFQKPINENQRYIGLLLLSAIPVALLGFFGEDKVDALFEGNIHLVGAMLLLTGVLLMLSQYITPKKTRPLNTVSAFIIGIAQSIAVLPGLSRSGSTITTALMLGVSREEASRFSFLMLIVPILGASAVKLKEDLPHLSSGSFSNMDSFVAGFFAALIAGFFACKLMIMLVNKQKLSYFAIYCWIIGLLALLA
ncbi:MAG: undecaprenyl-diphosphate phosphatase [Chitinophagales bacterium]|nr:undecaprenyl-diphosphate phosphatase [Bacteroidota bacterium]MCB9043026.1 undecaprenyl-diphosphate phosphatase [Chitinophagales bacterium]